MTCPNRTIPGGSPIHPEALRWIDDLALQPHPEGGWFRETYRSARQVAAAALPPEYDGPRALGTSITYLLAGEAVSRLHRLRGDEVWHHHAGGGLDLHLFWLPTVSASTPRYEQRRLGVNREQDRAPQVIVPGGCWFGATLAAAGGYALVGCTMAPGYDSADSTCGVTDELRAAFPAQNDLLARLG